MMATLFGMALGGWMSGVIFDLTGSYQAAFANGVAWNVLNVSIATWLLIADAQRNAAEDGVGPQTVISREGANPALKPH